LAVSIGAINKVLSTTKNVSSVSGSTDELMGSFSDALKKALTEVGDLQVKADDLIQKFSVGKVQDIHQVTAAVEEASLAMQLTLQLRNKAIEAYQEIMRMQV
jgi:flagellar hook-basal body complex protein FliE